MMRSKTERTLLVAIALVSAVCGAGTAMADDPTAPSAAREAALPESVGPTIPDGSSSDVPACQTAPSEALESSDSALAGVLRGESPIHQTWSCSYCDYCAPSLVNKACCFTGSGTPACVGSCSTGCDEGGGGPVFPDD